MGGSLRRVDVGLLWTVIEYELGGVWRCVAVCGGEPVQRMTEVAQ